MYKQRGFSIFTFFVFLLGIIVGVSIAAVVAFKVSKAPIPLVNKHNQPGELRAKPDWNPNQMLLQTDSAQSGQSSDGQSTQYPQGEDPPAIATLSPTGGERTALSTPGASDGSNGGNGGVNASSGQAQFFVQAGAFASEADAEQQRARLALSGQQATVTKVTAAGQTLHRVRIGPYASRDAASIAQKNLAADGIGATVVSAQ